MNIDFDNKDCSMSFKFVNWFFEKKNREDDLGVLVQKCIDDQEFPIKAKQFNEIIEYFRTSKASKAELELVMKAWNEYRTLPEIQVLPINVLKAKSFENY